MAGKAGRVGRIVSSLIFNRSSRTAGRKNDPTGKESESWALGGDGAEGGKIEDVGDSIRRRSGPGCRVASIAGTVIVSVMVLSPSGGAHADLVAAWSFNDLEEASVWIPSDAGEAWLDLGSLHASSNIYAGSAINAPLGWAAGDAIGLQGAAVESGSLFLGIESGLGSLDLDESMHVSFAARRSETGFGTVLVETWSEGSWSLVESLNIETDWGLHQVSPIPIDPQIGLLLRFTMQGSSSSQGTIRFDNLRIDTNPVPAPASAALVGLGGLLGVGGRRRI